MKLEVCSIYDSKVNAYRNPFYSRTRGEAIRMFQSTVDNEQTEMNKYPCDFALMHMGTWDDISGEFTNSNPPTNLGLASEFKTISEPR